MGNRTYTTYLYPLRYIVNKLGIEEVSHLFYITWHI